MDEPTENKGQRKFMAGEAVAETLRPVPEKYLNFKKNKDILEQIYVEAARKASRMTARALDKACRKPDFVRSGCSAQVLRERARI